MTTIKKNINLTLYLIALLTLLMVKTVIAKPAKAEKTEQAWHLKSDMVLEASFIELKEGQVYLENDRGLFALELSQFTDADQRLITRSMNEQLAVISASSTRQEQLYAGMRVSLETIFATGYLLVTIVILLLARKRWYFKPYNLNLMTGLLLAGMVVFAYFSQL